MNFEMRGSFVYFVKKNRKIIKEKKKNETVFPTCFTEGFRDKNLALRSLTFTLRSKTACAEKEMEELVCCP